MPMQRNERPRAGRLGIGCHPQACPLRAVRPSTDGLTEKPCRKFPRRNFPTGGDSWFFWGSRCCCAARATRRRGAESGGNMDNRGLKCAFASRQPAEGGGRYGPHVIAQLPWRLAPPGEELWGAGGREGGGRASPPIWGLIWFRQPNRDDGTAVVVAAG